MPVNDNMGMKTKQPLHVFECSGHEVSILALEPCCCCQGRPVCVLTIGIQPLLSDPYQYRQPFYRSSGRNSGMPDIWLPFKGICDYSYWFNKRFRQPLHEETIWEKSKSEKAHGRWGHPVYKIISDWLSENEEWVDSLPVENDIAKASKLCPLID